MCIAGYFPQKNPPTNIHLPSVGMIYPRLIGPPLPKLLDILTNFDHFYHLCPCSTIFNNFGTTNLRTPPPQPPPPPFPPPPDPKSFASYPPIITELDLELRERLRPVVLGLIGLYQCPKLLEKSWNHQLSL